ncbi:MAG: FAD/NAD(P)-binding protein [Elusimicrobia bacterium]|nr:FAD/NAD(P)-binding protein [Elusimicrobiota bacterium]
MSKDPYRAIDAWITGVIDETPAIKTFVVKPEIPLKFRTGQFIQFTLYGEGEAPFTPSSSHFEAEKFEVTIMRAGRVTEKIHKLKQGDVIGIRGPLGNGYPLEEFEGKEILILGGGVGMAPLRSLLLTLLAEKEKYKKISLLYGSKTPDDIVYKSQFDNWRKKGAEIFQSVDKCETGEWKGKIGVVTCLFEDIKPNAEKGVAIVCGPPIMMKFGTLKLLELGYSPDRIYLSMEKNMSCGIGKCGHCALGKYFVCKDGPVFKYSEIKDIEGIWD